MVDQYFAALCFAGLEPRYCCDTNPLSDGVSCRGRKDVADVCWLPELTEGKSKLRELQAVHLTVLLPAC
jgi:hypothetical protein